MGIFLFRKNKLRCPKCGGTYDKTDAFTQMMGFTCFKCHCDLITEDEYQSCAAYTNPTVECPYCHSTNTTKISKASKAADAALFGTYALGKISKQWHCERCGSDF